MFTLVSLNDAEFLEIFLELVVDVGGDRFLVARVRHEDTAVEMLALVEQNVRRTHVHLVLPYFLQQQQQLLLQLQKQQQQQQQSWGRY